jgi:hypothetical protein
MKEIFEFRLNNEYSHMIINPGEGKRTGSNTIIHITKSDPKFEKIKLLSKRLREENNDFLFLYSNTTRKYSLAELNTALLLQLQINSTFEPTGEECGTIYDSSNSCKVCGANDIQTTSLKLKKGSIPKKDISRTIGGEIVVSERFVFAANKYNLKGPTFLPIEYSKEKSNYHQLVTSNTLSLSNQTLTGVNIFDFSEESPPSTVVFSDNIKAKFEKEVYKCPLGHTLGLNLLSEAYVKNSPLVKEMDFFQSEQKIGVRRGLLRPESLYFCSHNFFRMVNEEKLTGFNFEIANI